MTAAVASRQYDDLTPQTVLDALDGVGLRGDGRIIQLNSFENRVFQVFLEDGRVVVAKFYRPGRWTDAQILEEHSFALELAQAEVPVVPPWVLQPAADATAVVDVRGDPPTLGCVRGSTHRVSVSTRCAGREPELEAEATLRQLGRFIGRLHDVGRRRKFEFRHVIDPQADGLRARQLLLAGGFVPPEVEAAWDSVTKAALEQVQRAFDGVPGLRRQRLHGDCHLGNVLWRDGAPHVVDLDDACVGPAVQDLWMLVSGDARSMEHQLALMLDGYTQFMDFDRRELSLIEPLRTLRMVRHSAWLAERWGDPAFPRAFPFFGTAAYWSQQIVQMREQLELMGPAVLT